jgi:hypothetical protein
MQTRAPEDFGTADAAPMPVADRRIHRAAQLRIHRCNHVEQTRRAPAAEEAAHRQPPFCVNIPPGQKATTAPESQSISSSHSSWVGFHARRTLRAALPGSNPGQHEVLPSPGVFLWCGPPFIRATSTRFDNFARQNYCLLAVRKEERHATIPHNGSVRDLSNVIPAYQSS